MFSRLVRSLVTLAAVIVAYQVYVLMAVPLLEPTVTMRQSSASTEADRQRASQSVGKHQRFLAAYFPPDHWTQTRPPIVLERGAGMLVLDEYDLGDDHRAEFERCAVLFFPSGREEGQPPPGDAVIIETDDRVTLEFDEDFNPIRGELGTIQRGSFPGLITIRSDMREPGPQDDLRIETRDLQLNSQRLFTNREVQFRLGPNVGSGRQLEIHFLRDDQAGAASGGLNVAGIESLEVHEDVRLQLFVDSKSLLDREKQSATATGKTDEPPVEVTCTGPFVFDLVSSPGEYVAQFHDNVEVWQLNPTGPSDQLSCQKLELFFRPASVAGQTTAASEPPWRREQGQLEPHRLVATGFPVVMVSPAREVEARGQRLQVKITERKVALDGGRDVMLTYGPNVLRAPAIQYEHPADDAQTRIGNFRAQGPGTLRFVPNPAKPDEALYAAWQENVQLDRQQDQPVLSMSGRPELSMQGRGRLTADEMHVYLHEMAAGDPSQGGITFSHGDGQTRVVPDRLSARGNVLIDSPQLGGQTHELSAWFLLEPEAATTDDEADEAASDRFTFGSEGESTESYAIQADELRLEIALRGRRAVPRNLSCQGNVVFRETTPQPGGDEPLVLYGNQLGVERIDTDAAQITVRGAPAEVTARGVVLKSTQIKIDESDNRAWIDGAGEARMTIDRDLEGRPVAAPYPLTIRWRGGLDFDGKNVVLREEVVAQGPDDWLRCDELTATLSRTVEFGGQMDRQALDLSEIDCRGNVVLDHRARDDAGPTSHERMELARLAINQHTGAIEGSGPGWVRSVHYSDPTDLTIAANDRGAPPPAGNQRLHFLRVDFLRGLTGNLHRKELTFQQRVHCVYGPVDSWDGQLDSRRPESLPPGAVVLRCDELTVNEDPLAASEATSTSAKMGPVELTATDNVVIEGSDPKRGSFVAQAQRASYDQMKDLFVLEGDTVRSATISFRRRPEDPPAESAARKISYFRRTGDVKADDIRSFDFIAPPR